MLKETLKIVNMPQFNPVTVLVSEVGTKETLNGPQEQKATCWAPGAHCLLTALEVLGKSLLDPSFQTLSEPFFAPD